MSNKILVTDSLFIEDRHVKMLEDAGYEVERLDKPEATEDELCEAVKGKVGYILGGTERVTDKVFNAADELKAIVFTGTDFKVYMPGHQRATEKGIAIGAAPHINAHSVAEFGFTMTMMMVRDVIGLARGGSKSFETTNSLADLKVGIVGLGHVGSKYAEMAKGIGVSELYYFSHTKKPEQEKRLGIKFLQKREICSTCDVVFAALPAQVGEHFFDAEDISVLKRGAIVVSIGEPEQFDLATLYSRLSGGEIRAAFDVNVHEERFQKLPLDIWYTPNSSTAFNTAKTIEDVSTSCVRTLINILKTGNDQYKTN